MTDRRVRITDVSPRDGLQNEPGVIPTARKADLVRALLDARPDEIEVSSFVSAKWIPQLGDAAELFALLAAHKPGAAVFSALVPNEKGLDAALDVNRRAAAAAPGRRLIDKLSVFTAASETFAQRNTGATIAQTLDRFVPVVARAHAEGLLVRGYVSCAVACPFEGPIPPAAAADVAARLADLGVDEIDVADTIGAADARSTRAMLDAVLARLGPAWLEPRPSGEFALTLHLHDTFGRAAECLRTALDMGLRSFDSSVAGLGGCPYASTPGRRAPGNVSTELVDRTAREAGLETRLDPHALARAAALATDIVAHARAAGAQA